MIVDDSAVARAVLARMATSRPGFEVAALAGNAAEALDALKTVQVDIVLLDVEMPGTSGLDALPQIIRAGRGAKVLIVSSMAEEGAEVTVRALAEGAADTLPKPGTGYFAGRFAEVLADRLRRIGHAVPKTGESSAAVLPVRLRAMPEAELRCVALGASTGGLRPLTEFLRSLPARLGVPILVTQHLPPVFMPYFARQLASAAGRAVLVAEDRQAVVNDVVYLAPGDAHLCLDGRAVAPRVRLDRHNAASGCLPSVDSMLSSMADLFGAGSIGIIFSGMGRDGLAGSARLVECGGAVLVQDQASAAIWGMPRVVAEAGLASAVLPPGELARRVAQIGKDSSWS